MVEGKPENKAPAISNKINKGVQTFLIIVYPLSFSSLAFPDVLLGRIL
jgi:hypothetical protein